MEFYIVPRFLDLMWDHATTVRVFLLLPPVRGGRCGAWDSLMVKRVKRLHPSSLLKYLNIGIYIGLYGYLKYTIGYMCVIIYYTYVGYICNYLL